MNISLYGVQTRRLIHTEPGEAVYVLHVVFRVLTHTYMYVINLVSHRLYIDQA